MQCSANWPPTFRPSQPIRAFFFVVTEPCMNTRLWGPILPYFFHFVCTHEHYANKKDGYRQQNVRQRQKLFGIRGLSRSLKLMPFKSLGAVSYSPSIVTMAVSAAILEIFSVKNGMTLKTWLGFIQGHWKWHHLIDCIRVPISFP